MASTRTITLFCWILGLSNQSFSVDIEDSRTVDYLKKAILKEKPAAFPNVDPDELTLWKESITIDKDLNNKVTQRPFLDQDALLEVDTLSDIFPHPEPTEKTLHIVIRSPRVVRSIPMMSRMGSNPPVIQGRWTPRRATVDSLYARLVSTRLVQVRGTSGTGKTTLMELLHDHILKHDCAATVEVIKGWPKEDGTTIKDRIRQRIKTYPSISSRKLYLLFDNAHDTYWDGHLWENFFKDVVQRGSGPLAILFCRYGSPTAQPVEYDEGNPPILPPSSRISLTPYHDHSGFPPIGLLFSREEFDEAVDRFRGFDNSRIHVDQELQQILFEWTMGHAGAVGDLLARLSQKEHQKLRDGGTLIVDDLLKIQQIGKLLSDLPNFARGLPTFRDLKKPGVATVLRKLLTECYIIASGNSDEDFCHRRGWMQCEQHQDKTCYMFSSPLHAVYLSWLLTPILVQCPYMTVQDMAFSILKKFKPSRLSSPSRIGVAFSDRPLEARYQFEFYRGLFAATGGGVRIGPELFTAPGARRGHIDFFIPEKKWGIELTREGNAPSEQSSRFFGPGAWLDSKDMVDYIILDCWTMTPKSANPDKPNLFHAIFEDNFSRLTILNNMLQKVEEPIALSEG